jgi:hypothetical protein
MIRWPSSDQATLSCVPSTSSCCCSRCSDRPLATSMTSGATFCLRNPTTSREPSGENARPTGWSVCAFNDCHGVTWPAPAATITMRPSSELAAALPSLDTASPYAGAVSRCSCTITPLRSNARKA